MAQIANLGTPELLFSQGDMSAFEELWKRHQDELRRYIISLVRGNPDAQHIAEDVLSSLSLDLATACLRKTYTGNPSVPWVGWAKMCARHAVSHYFRRPANRRMQPLGTTDKPTYVDPGQRLAQEELAADLSGCLQELSPVQREMVRLKIAGLTLREIAAELSLTVGSVIHSYYPAIEQLRACMESKGWSDPPQT